VAAPTSSRRRVRAVHRRLLRRFGPLRPPRRTDPLEELILTILSQNTSDANSGRAYAALRERFPTWEALAAARPAEVARAIRVGGLANVKAPRILAVLREIRRRQGRLDLSWMHRAGDAEVTGYLRSLPGVGPKTAAIVLAFSLGRPALPVDTHVHRVVRRLGLVPPRASAEAAHRVLEGLAPPELKVELHVGLIRLGREICKAGRPRCERCPLADLCPTAPTVLGTPGTSGTRAPAPGRRAGASGSG
jgi:endonuclease-3